MSVQAEDATKPEEEKKQVAVAADGGCEDEEEDVLDSHYGGSQLTNAVVFESLLQKTLEGEEQPKQKQKRKRCSPNIQALAISAFLFSLITVVQIFAAKVAHSQALLMDCISMAVDAITYAGNIVVECKKADGGKHVPSQLLVVGVSLSCLIYFTIDASMESWGAVQVCMGIAEEDVDGEDDVNGKITLGFALAGVVFDLLCLWGFHRSNKKTAGSRQVNMFSALLHVSADFMRSMSTVIMSVLILSGAFDSMCLDAYTSVFVGGTIIGGALMGFYKWLRMLISWCRSKASEEVSKSIG